MQLVCLCWGLTSQSTIFQSCRDGATASWVINQYFRGVKCLAQGHNTAAVGIEPPTSRSGVRHSTTEPPRSPWTQLIACKVSDTQSKGCHINFVRDWLCSYFWWTSQKRNSSLVFTLYFCIFFVHYLSRLMTKPTKWLCAQWRLRSAWASAQSD